MYRCILFIHLFIRYTEFPLGDDHISYSRTATTLRRRGGRPPPHTQTSSFHPRVDQEADTATLAGGRYVVTPPVYDAPVLCRTPTTVSTTTVPRRRRPATWPPCVRCLAYDSLPPALATTRCNSQGAKLFLENKSPGQQALSSPLEPVP